MVLYALFGHNHTSTGQTVIVNNNVTIDDSQVTAVPEGSHISGFGDQRTIIVPTQNGDQIVPIPVNSTFTQTDDGTLITTPTGVGVLVPNGEDAYKAPVGYDVPPEAAKPMEYDDLQDDSAWYANPWVIGIMVLGIGLTVVAVVKVTR